MNDSSLRSVVGSLQLRDIDNVAAHARRGNETAILEIDLVAIDIGAFHSLSPPVKACRACTVECAVQIGVHDIMVVFDPPIKHRTLCPRDACIGNENVEAAIFVDDLVDCRLDMLLISDVDLVGFAYKRAQNNLMGAWV